MRSLYNDPILGNKLLCEFLMNEDGSAYIHDASPNKMRGQLITPDWVIETFGYNKVPTLDFVVASIDYVDLGSDAMWEDVAGTNDAITFEMLFFSDAALGTVQTLVASMVDGTAGVAAFPQLLIDTNGYLLFRPCVDDTGAGKEVSTTPTVETAAWKHVVAAYAKSDAIASLLINGGTEITGTMTGTTDVTAPGAESVFLGLRKNFDAGPAFENYFDGRIALFRAWSRRLTVHERGVLYARAHAKYAV
jgi:hypothetical protein